MVTRNNFRVIELKINSRPPSSHHKTGVFERLNRAGLNPQSPLLPKKPVN
jgi:hypothetical protein